MTGSPDDPPSFNALDCLLLATKTDCVEHAAGVGFACVGDSIESAGVCYGRVKKAWTEGHRLVVDETQ